MDLNEIWLQCINKVFKNKPGILKNLSDFSKIISFNNNVLKVRIFKTYLEISLEKEINNIKNEIFLLSKIKIRKIYLNNKIFSFNSFNISSDSEKKIDIENNAYLLMPQVQRQKKLILINILKIINR